MMPSLVPPLASTDTPARVDARADRVWMWTGWLALAALLVFAVPLFLRMGVWVDSTFYDVAAWTVLNGGVHYRDVFDTNLPGMLWLHVLVRSLFGWRYEALRGVDLVVVSAAIWLLIQYLARLGIGSAARVWTALVLYAFYFSLPELSHCQRDIWQLAPALAALHLLDRRTTLASGGARATTLARIAGLEGLCWAAAAWIKPFVLVPAACCWVTARRAAGSHERDRRAALAGLLGGGALAAVLGVGWLVASGTWPFFFDVMARWNPEYAGHHGYHWHARRAVFMGCAMDAMPWTLVGLIAIPLAVIAAAPLRGRGVRDGRTTSAVLLATFYLGWLLQVLVVQPRIHCYTLDSSILVGIAAIPALAPAGWWSVPLVRGIVLEFALWALLVHPVVRSERLSLWRSAVTAGSPELRDKLSLTPSTTNGRIAWTDLQAVADYLGGRGLHDGELLCFNDATHPLYIQLGIKPPLRYIQWGVIAHFTNRHEQVSRELEATAVRVIVTDLTAVGLGSTDPVEPLPTALTWRFPWNYPVAFRSGPYVVHDVDGRIESAASW